MNKKQFPKVAFVDFPDTGNWQGVIPAGAHWYGVEARQQKDTSEDCYIYQFPAPKNDGDKIVPTGAPMQVNATPGNKVHPTGWGVSDDGVLWLTFNGEGVGNDVVTVNYVSGKVVKKSDCQIMEMFTNGNAQIAFDESNEMASVRIVITTHDTHVLRKKQDILDKKNKVLGTVKIPRKDNRVVQGFTLVKHAGVWELRVLVGLKSKKSPYGIERWNAETGKFISTLSLNDDLGREPEGIDGDLVGFKTEKRSGIDVYRYTV